MSKLYIVDILYKVGYIKPCLREIPIKGLLTANRRPTIGWLKVN